MHRLPIFGEPIKFPLLAVDGVVDEVVDGVLDGVVLGVVREVVLVMAALCSSTADVWFAHTSGSSDAKTARFVEIACQVNPAPTKARARWWHVRGMSRMQPAICFYTPAGRNTNSKVRPVIKYQLQRGVGFMKFLENGSRPQPPTSPLRLVSVVFLNVQP